MKTAIFWDVNGKVADDQGNWTLRRVDTVLPAYRVSHPATKQSLGNLLSID